MRVRVLFLTYPVAKQSIANINILVGMAYRKVIWMDNLPGPCQLKQHIQLLHPSNEQLTV
jgi:hypothetical protein